MKRKLKNTLKGGTAIACMFSGVAMGFTGLWFIGNGLGNAGVGVLNLVYSGLGGLYLFEEFAPKKERGERNE